MIEVKSNTAKGEALLSRAIRYEGYELWDVYGSVSSAKIKAYRDCRKKCNDEGGTDFRICGHCISNFSVSWKVADGWRLETYRNSYKIVDAG